MKKTTISSNFNFADNYHKFSTFCKVQPDRDNRLAQNIFDLTNNKKSLSILDIGSSDGRIIPHLIKKTSVKSIECSILAIEPDAIAFDELFLLTKDKRIKAIPMEYEIFYTEVKEKFDLILATHVFYHFDNPGSIINSIFSLLSHDGQAILTIDSNDSPIYQRRGSILKKISNITSVDFYGKYYFGEDLSDTIKSLKFNVKEVNLISNLNISITPNIEECKLAEVISFLHRFDIVSISEKLCIRDLFSDFIRENTYKIPWKETMFVISK